MTPGSLKIRVLIGPDGNVVVRAPEGHQTMQIVARRDKLADAVGQRVSELVTDLLGPHADVHHNPHPTTGLK